MRSASTKRLAVGAVFAAGLALLVCGNDGTAAEPIILIPRCPDATSTFSRTTTTTATTIPTSTAVTTTSSFIPTTSCVATTTITVTVTPTSVSQVTTTLTATATATTTTSTQPPEPTSLLDEDISEWLQSQIPFSKDAMFANINPADTVPGIVVASPSREKPNYFYHWVRDAALTLDVVVNYYKTTSDPSEIPKYEKILWDFAALSQKHQAAKGCEPRIQGVCEATGGPGEVKYHPNGTLYTNPWGRPQNDGPALRASTLMRFANAYLARGGDLSVVKSRLYDGKFPSTSPIKVDLEYVSNNWKANNFDLWEEVPANSHFFTRLVQRRALIEGAEFATKMGDAGAGKWYKSQADAIEKEVAAAHWNNVGGYIPEMVGTPDWYKRDGRNVATVLAVLHGYNEDGYFSPVNDRVLATVERLRQDFDAEYTISKTLVDSANLTLGTPYGRYKEDVYDGTQGSTPTLKGNPWHLCTFAVAELLYAAIQEYQSTQSITITQTSLPFFSNFLNLGNSVAAGRTYTPESPVFAGILRAMAKEAEATVRRVKFHVQGDGGHMAEQINRETGRQQSAGDLTWSYAALLTAEMRRRGLVGKVL
ncbi:glycoside hydrolase 15 protein [Quaeritorhiza haematococci]|nr:glycoside hydrolase 15 protein [Quaeritorhiza haematococci]